MGQLLRDLSTYYENALNKRDNIDLSKSIVAFSESSSVDQEIVPQYSLQNKIRPLFGKTGFNPPMIGNHPDFNY